MNRPKRGVAFSPRSPCARIGLVLVLALLSGAGGALAQSLRGRVLDDSTGAGLAGARVDLLGQDGHEVQQVLTSEDGTFRLHVPGIGKYRVRARRLGYAPRATPLLDLSARDTLAIALRLTTTAVTLTPITVVGRRGDVTVFSPYLEMERYYDRKARYGIKGMGFGVFLDGDKLRPGAFGLADLIGDVPGVHLVAAGGNRVVVHLRGGCVPTIFLDGTFMGTGASEDVEDGLPPASDVAAIEVYPGMVGRRCGS